MPAARPSIYPSACCPCFQPRQYMGAMGQQGAGWRLANHHVSSPATGEAEAQPKSRRAWRCAAGLLRADKGASCEVSGACAEPALAGFMR